MSDVLILTVAFLAGMALSVPMFVGLWWTVRRLPTVRRPWMLALVSFWGRLGLTVLGFYLITGGDWRRGLAALIGFLLGRAVLLRLLAPGRSMARVQEA